MALHPSQILGSDMQNRESRPNVEQILAHPAYPDTIWKFKPTQNGKLPVAVGRGGPFNIDWEVHGNGDIKLVVCVTPVQIVCYCPTCAHK
jgi:hypothetical protein